MQQKHNDTQTIIISYSSNKELALENVTDFLPTGFTAKPSIDTLEVTETGSIGISISRQIKDFLSSTPLESDYKLVVIQQAHQLTIAAQNALLKLLEEPPSYGYIILITPNPQVLLDTIRSRCQIYHLKESPTEAATAQKLSTFWQELLLQPIGKRMQQIEKYQKQRDVAEKFMSQTIRYFREQLRHSPSKETLFNLTLSLYVYKLIQQNSNLKLALDTLVMRVR